MYLILDEEEVIQHVMDLLDIAPTNSDVVNKKLSELVEHIKMNFELYSLDNPEDVEVLEDVFKCTTTLQ